MLCRLRQKEDAPRIAIKMNETSKGGSGLCIAYIHIDRVLPLDIGIHGRGGGELRDKGNFSTACETSEKRELSRGKICNLQRLRLPHRQHFAHHCTRVCHLCARVCVGHQLLPTKCKMQQLQMDGLDGLGMGWPYCGAALKKMLLERDPLSSSFPFSPWLQLVHCKQIYIVVFLTILQISLELKQSKILDL